MFTIHSNVSPSDVSLSSDSFYEPCAQCNYYNADHFILFLVGFSQFLFLGRRKRPMWAPSFHQLQKCGSRILGL